MRGRLPLDIKKEPQKISQCLASSLRRLQSSLPAWAWSSTLAFPPNLRKGSWFQGTHLKIRSAVLGPFIAQSVRESLRKSANGRSRRSSPQFLSGFMHPLELEDQQEWCCLCYIGESATPCPFFRGTSAAGAVPRTMDWAPSPGQLSQNVGFVQVKTN